MTINSTIPTEAPKFKVIQRKNTSFKNIILDGTSYLRVDKVSSYVNVKYKLDSNDQLGAEVGRQLVKETVKTLVYRLEEVTADELKQHRNSAIPGFVLKKDNKLYYTAILGSISFAGTIYGEHRCGNCLKLSAASDEKGGCQKVRERAHCIERYNWIREGYETFNTIGNHDVFIVEACEHYDPYKKPEKKSA